MVPEHSATPTQYMALALKRLLRIFLDIYIYVTVFGKTNRLARKTNFFFIALLPFTSSEDAAIQI